MGNDNTLTKEEWAYRLEEFNYHCAYCLKPQSVVGTLELEHMTPASKGGGTTLDNTAPACRGCNASKHTKSLIDLVVLNTPNF